MVDNGAGDLPIFESGAIMWYLGTQHDPQGKIFPKVSICCIKHALAIWWDLFHSYPVTSAPCRQMSWDCLSRCCSPEFYPNPGGLCLL